MQFTINMNIYKSVNILDKFIIISHNFTNNFSKFACYFWQNVQALSFSIHLFIIEIHKSESTFLIDLLNSFIIIKKLRKACYKHFLSLVCATLRVQCNLQYKFVFNVLCVVVCGDLTKSMCHPLSLIAWLSVTMIS